MTDHEALEALSKKATQGVWSVCEYDAGSHIYDAGGFPTPSIQCEEADCGIVHWDGFKQEYWVSANGNAKQIEANAAFIVALVNAYRTGQLIPAPSVDDAMVERVARALRRYALGNMSNEAVARRIVDRSWELEVDAARAAISAMQVKP